MIYENIKRLCNEKGITISTLEKACGISNGTIGKWADGKSAPRVPTAQRIAEYFGVSVDELLKSEVDS